jgi:hypothetical protein
MLIRDAIDWFFAIVGQMWSTHAIWQKYILTLAQMALYQMRSYKGYNWTWQHRKDSFITVQWETVKLVTTHPVVKVDKFYWWTMKPRDWVILNPQSFCEACPTEWAICIPCSCECLSCSDLWMKYANPQDDLCPWFFQISGSEYQGMWGLNGKIIRAKLNRPVEALWVTYYRWAPKLQSFDDKFPLPEQFMLPFCYFMAFIALGRYWQFRAWEEVNFLQVANTIMDDLKELSYNAPSWIQFDNWDLPNVGFY